MNHEHAHHHAKGKAIAPAAPPAVQAEAALYTCPMHPQIRQPNPGSCPICGMALEPVMPTEAEDDAALRRVRRRFWIATALATPVVLLAMLPHVWDLHLSPSANSTLRHAQWLLSAPVLWTGADYFRRGWHGVVNRTPNMYTLIGLGVAVAFAYSLFATFLPEFFPLAMRDAIDDGRLKKGKLVVLAAVGAGYTVGAVLTRWAY